MSRQILNVFVEIVRAADMIVNDNVELIEDCIAHMKPESTSSYQTKQKIQADIK